MSLIRSEASEASFSNIFGKPKTNLKTPRAALAALTRLVKLGFRRWLWGKTAMACVRRTGENLRSVGIEVLAKPIFGRGLPLPMAGAPCARRINGDFTRPAGVGKIGDANFSEGGKTPCLKNTAQNCEAILLTITQQTRCRVLTTTLCGTERQDASP